MAEDWVNAVSSVLHTLCQRGRITLRRTQARWQRAMPGFVLISQRYACAGSGVIVPPGSSPETVSHSLRLRAIAVLAHAASSHAHRDTWTYTLQGNWNPVLFDSLITALAKDPALLDDSSPEQQATPRVGVPGTRQQAGVKRQRRGGIVDAAGISDSNDSSSSNGSNGSNNNSAGSRASSTLVPEVPAAEGMPEPLVALLQLALLLRRAITTPDRLRIDRLAIQEDGTVNVTVGRSAAGASNARRPVVVSSTVSFPRLLDDTALMQAADAMILDNGDDSDLFVRWKELLVSQNLLLSLWLSLPMDFVDTESIGSMAAMPFPSQSHPKMIAFHPLLRWDPDLWNAFSVSMAGDASTALHLLLRHGAFAAFDVGTWCTCIICIIDAGFPRLASGLCRVILGIMARRQAGRRNREKLLLGGMSVLMNMLPDYIMAGLTRVYEARAHRKLGRTDPEALAKAVEAVEMWHQAGSLSLSQITQMCISMIGETHIRAIENILGIDIPSLARHQDYAKALRDAVQVGWLLVTAELFAVLHLQAKPAAEVYRRALDLWHPGSARVNWQITAEYEDVAPYGIPQDHMFCTFPAVQYANAIAEAPDADTMHIEDALIKVTHALTARHDVMGPLAPGTLRASAVMDKLMSRR